MNDPRQFNCFDDYDNDGWGKPYPDDDYIEPSEDWVNVEDETPDTDV
jgi:hypothetical protein